ncbi:MAG: hypothetical protein HY723_06425 [Chloroflexi bacterium]|nr:hypothetical protein [Chloroflexota bacterium]
MLRINRTFIREWAGEYNRLYRPRDRADERAIKGWLRGQPAFKHLDKGHFVRLASWKSPRGRARYERNAAPVVREVTRLACHASNEQLKVRVLMLLDGVSVTVAATILHFFYPRRFPIFDKRARTTLSKAGLWRRSRISDASLDAWSEYVPIMRRLARRYRVSLRDLDKALYAYDRWR